MQAGEENKLKRIRQIQIADLFYSAANLFSRIVASLTAGR